MGGGYQYIETGGFSEYLYETVGKTENINGLRCKMIRRIDGKKEHAQLPSYSNTSDVYLRPNADDIAVQAKVYESRRMIVDFDWSHTHVNQSDGRFFKEGVVHVQKYHFVGVNDKGKHIFERISGEARLMNNAEIKKYGPVLRKFNPNVKFR